MANTTKYYVAYFPETRERYIESRWDIFRAYTFRQSVIIKSFKTIKECNQWLDEVEKTCESRRKYWQPNNSKGEIIKSR